VTLGALLRGIEGGIVETRIIRAAYGVQAREPWTPDVHEQGELKRTAEKNKYLIHFLIFSSSPANRKTEYGVTSKASGSATTS
jgi:hypothetical protein